MSAKRNASGSGAWRAVFWIAILVCVCALGALGFIVYSYWSANHGYEQIATAAFTIGGDESSGSKQQEQPVGDTLGSMTVDWDYLRSINSDVVAWVYMPGTAINYPVVHTADNETYLTMDFNQQNGFSARCGTIFLDCNNRPDFSDANNVLYGHHMNDGSMFACISKQLEDNDEFNAHRTIYVLTPDMNYQCETFALVITDGYEMLVETNFPDNDALANYVLDKQQRSAVWPSEGMPDAYRMGKLFTFSTCDYAKDNGRAVLFSQVVAQAVPGSTGSGEAISEEDVAAMQDAQEAA